MTSDTKFDSMMREIEEEARAEGPEAVAELEEEKRFWRDVRDNLTKVRDVKIAEESACIVTSTSVQAGPEQGYIGVRIVGLGRRGQRAEDMSRARLIPKGWRATMPNDELGKHKDVIRGIKRRALG
jgi:hypothetical protein